MTISPAASPVPPVALGPGEPRPPLRVALIGNPNTGKTTLFNRLTGLRHHTSNFPGTTVDARIGQAVAGEWPLELVDLPGVYSLELAQAESVACRDVLAGAAAPRGEAVRAPDGVLVVLDATNLARNLALAGEALRRRLPTVVALNMVDLLPRHGLSVDTARLSAALGCPVVAISARSGQGLDELRRAIVTTIAPGPGHDEGGIVPSRTPPARGGAGHGSDALHDWAEGIYAECVSGAGRAPGTTRTDRADRLLTHPVGGTIAFAIIMTGLFYTIFALAQYPMEWIDAVFAHAGGAVDALWAALGLEGGFIHDLLKDGVIAGIGATVIFLPQICLLFFLISILEDTGYLARGAFVMDRLLRPFGLAGHSFVPLLSSHACALPGIMATRTIPDTRQRLTTILVAPFMTCSARLPVYVLLTGLLFAGRPLAAALAFVGCYALGITAGALSALVARRTILRGPVRPMALELPSYKRPSLRTALTTALDRGILFLRKAGTTILAIAVVLWWLGAFPHVQPPPAAEELRQTAAALRQAPTPQALASALAATGERLGPHSEGQARALVAEAGPSAATGALAAWLEERADGLEASHAKRQSLIGHLGRAVEPVFRPLGFDWQLSVGVLASFAAREVFVSTMAVVVTGRESGEDEGVRQQLAAATRDDGRTPIFSTATSWSLLIFFVLAMQCLPTLVVTARESGHVKWALLQLVWMSGVAYLAALGVYQLLTAAGVP